VTTLNLRLPMWLLFSALALAPMTAYAQANNHKPITQSEVKNFDAYLDQHQDVRADLAKNPKLIDDPGYLNKHAHLKTFLEHHPNTRQELRENPGAFMQRENGYERNEDRSAAAGNNDITQSELRNWDEYLDKHSDVQKDLSKNPNLIDDPAYLNKHPHLKTFLEHHPNTRQELKENPKAVMNREHRYEKAENKKPKGK
jgi:phage-related protein